MDRRTSADGEGRTPDPVLRLDRLLRFDPWVAERYEHERGAERVMLLRHQTYVGLLLYNAYLFTGIFLTPDIIGVAVSLRLFAVTPASLLLAWIMGHVRPKVREWLITIGMINALAVPAFLFWFTHAPLGGYTFGELALILVYGNMLLLRFPQAIVFTAGALALAIAFVLTKGGIPHALRVALVFQAVTACIWTLYANYRSEIGRCRSYLEELRATLKSETSEATSHRLLDLSLTDALTTLPNRRALDQTVLRWSEERASLAIMMIDVDHFKLFNDALGHPTGDECLRAIALALSGVTTGTEHFVARFGGEEFTVVARDLDPFGAARLAKRIVEAVAALGIGHPGRSDGNGLVTISGGIALKPADMDPKTAFQAADTALYEAKRRGRNCYVMAGAGTDLPVQLASA